MISASEELERSSIQDTLTMGVLCVFFFSSRRRHTRFDCDWSSDVCSSDLAYGSVETAVEAMKAGATDFLLKSFSLDHLMQVVNKALEVRDLRDENRQLKAEVDRKRVG